MQTLLKTIIQSASVRDEHWLLAAQWSRQCLNVRQRRVWVWAKQVCKKSNFGFLLKSWNSNFCKICFAHVHLPTLKIFITHSANMLCSQNTWLYYLLSALKVLTNVVSIGMWRSLTSEEVNSNCFEILPPPLKQITDFDVYSAQIRDSLNCIAKCKLLAGLVQCFLLEESSGVS